MRLKFKNTALAINNPAFLTVLHLELTENL